MQDRDRSRANKFMNDDMPSGSSIAVDVAVRSAARLGEGPVWDPEDELLWWVDILEGGVLRSRIDGGSTLRWELPTLVGAVAPTAGGGAVVACQEGFGRLSPEGDFEVKLRVLSPDHRMNDAKCDKSGRMWAGSMKLRPASGEGTLHRLDPDWQSHVVCEGLSLPNGIGWSPDRKFMYLADSFRRVIEVFDFDEDDGAVSKRRPFIQFDDAAGRPDGLCVDISGCLWVAMWGGARVLRISPHGDVLGDVPMPVRQPTSCAFGGRDLDVLFVTSARVGLDLSDGEEEADGSVFALTGTGTQGMEQARFGGS
jgi:sugar lactone lactonase YvrE